MPVWKALVSALAIAAQARGFVSGVAGMSTSRVISPTVVASWRSHESAADGTMTSLLVLWRGTPGWFTKGGRGSGGGGAAGGGSGRGGLYAYEYLSYGGLTFTMEFDDSRHIVRLLNQEFALKETNVVLVDFVDSAGGPTIVGNRWVVPGPPAPPVVEGGAADPIAGIISRTPELVDYLQCDRTMPDPAANAMIALVCRMMRGEKVTIRPGSPR